MDNFANANRRAVALLLVALLLALFVTAQAFAGVTLLLGESQFKDHGDGVWYQEIYPYELHLKSGSVGLRYDVKLTDQTSYSLGYMNLGKVSSSAIAVGVDAPGDGGYDPVTRSCVGGCIPTSHWFGSGEVQGLYGSYVQHFGAWAVEAGLYLYRPTWTVSVPDWRGCRDCAPIPIETPNTAHWQVGPMLGLRYSINQWSLNLSTWHTQTEATDYSSLYHNQTWNLSMGYSF